MLNCYFLIIILIIETRRKIAASPINAQIITVKRKLTTKPRSFSKNGSTYAKKIYMQIIAPTK